LIRKKAGTRYSNLFKDADPSRWQRHSEPHNSFVRRFQHILNGDGSNVLDLVKNDGIKDEISAIYKKCTEMNRTGALLEGTNAMEMSMIFLELLLSNVRGEPILS
jgi:hypothetical protein